MKMQKEMTDSKTESADRMENVSEKEGKMKGLKGEEERENFSRWHYK